MEKTESASVRKKKFFEYLESSGVKKNIIDAYKQTDPARFFDKIFHDRLYSDNTIPIGYGEMSDPMILSSKLINSLDPQPNMKILEVGTGSGFTTAVLSLLCREVYTIEIDERLAAAAKTRLYTLGYENIRFFSGDGTDPSIDLGELDSAVIWGACYKRPIPVLQHVKKRGLMVFPMGPDHLQQIVVIKNEFDSETGSNFKTYFREQGAFTHIKGSYGYENVTNIGDEIMIETNEVDELPGES